MVMGYKIDGETRNSLMQSLLLERFEELGDRFTAGSRSAVRSSQTWWALRDDEDDELDEEEDDELDDEDEFEDDELEDEEEELEDDDIDEFDDDDFDDDDDEDLDEEDLEDDEDY